MVASHEKARFVAAGLLSVSLLFSLSPWASAEEPRRDTLGFIVSDKSGKWSEAQTWTGGKVPTAGSRVRVAEGHTVTYDVASDQVIRMIHVAGTLTFTRDRNTRLDVGLIRIQEGNDAGEDGFECEAHVKAPDPHKVRPALEIGTSQKPIDAKHTALVRLVYCEGMNKETCPAIVCCGGRWDVYGAPMNRTWVELGADASGAANVILAEPVSGWNVGDRIIVTGSKNGLHKNDGKLGGEGVVQTEERKIVKIDGATLMLDQPLKYLHPGTGEFRCEVANLSRNIVIESADPKMRGHTMYHKHSAGSLAYAEFRHLGKEGLLGKYAIHYHLAGDTMRGSSVVGVSVWDTHNHWLVIHGTDHMLVRDCVGYKSIGHGYFLEDGTEQYNALDRNLAVQAFRGKPLPKQNLPFDKNEGAGFWWANARNTFTRNVSCENQRYGFFFEMSAKDGFNTVLPLRMPDGSVKPHEVRHIPIFRFEDNEAHSLGTAGFVLGEEGNRIRGDKQHPFIVRKLRVWHANYAFRPSAEFLLAEDIKIHATSYGIKAPSLDQQVFRNITLNGCTATIIASRSPKHPAGISPIPRATFENVTITDSPGNMGFGATPDKPYEVHFKNFTVKNSGPRGIIGYNHKTSQPHMGVYYFHDYPKSGSVALVAHQDLAAKDTARDFKAAGFLKDALLRTAELKNVAFPTDLLAPVDDLAPATIITSVERRADKLLVRGVTHDNGAVRIVAVNGVEAKLQLVQTGLADWEALVDAPANGVLAARAIDRAGNAEAPGHRLHVK
jgi:G8 domain